MTNPSLYIAIDGSCSGNPGPGGWGVVIRYPDGQKSDYSGGAQDTTNQRMELQAALEAVSRIPLGMDATIYSDSQYVVKGINEWLQGWKQKGWRTSSGPVANQDLWEQLDRLAQKRQGALTWTWVRGHNGHPLNERANELAQSATEWAKEGYFYQEEGEPVESEKTRVAQAPVDLGANRIYKDLVERRQEHYEYFKSRDTFFTLLRAFEAARAPRADVSQLKALEDQIYFELAALRQRPQDTLIDTLLVQLIQSSEETARLGTEFREQLLSSFAEALRQVPDLPEQKGGASNEQGSTR